MTLDNGTPQNGDNINGMIRTSYNAKGSTKGVADLSLRSSSPRGVGQRTRLAYRLTEGFISLDKDPLIPL
jgi:outer membrane translocation and assembly module TamA